MAQRASLLLTGSPGFPAANPKTDTVYVPIQCAGSACSKRVAGRVDVIDAARCNARVASGCRVLATATVADNPLDVVVDQRTDTVYSVNGSGSVSVIDGANCNAKAKRGCSRPVATIPTGGIPVAGALDPRTRTLYLASLKGQVFAVDVARCSAMSRTGCRAAVRTIKDSGDPDSVDVDIATDTVYAADDGPTGNGDTVSVINGATCNGATGSGCDRTPTRVRVGSNPYWDTVDQATDTIYVANENDGTVSVIDGARCNATVSSGCKRATPAITTGAGAGFVAVDDALHTVFAMNADDDTVSAIDTRRCGGAHTVGCAGVAAAQQAASNLRSGYLGFPAEFALVPSSGSAYLVNVGGSGVLDVIDVRGCSAVNRSACRQVSSAADVHDYEAVVDPSTDTIYASSLSLPQVDVLNGATCTPGSTVGCAPVARIPIAHPAAALGAIDAGTHTLYAADTMGGTISVINTATCNAIDRAGCAATAPTFPVGPAPGSPVLNAATHTLYVVVGKSADHVAVLDTSICNAMTTMGCRQTPGSVAVGVNTDQLAVSEATDTVYAPSVGANATGRTVFMINGTLCNATDHFGCAQHPATVDVGAAPDGVAVQDQTGSVYVANNADGDAPGTVSVIKGATCNGVTTTGCRSVATVLVGRSPRQVAVDAATNRIYVTDHSSASVSIISGANCNAEEIAGCQTPAATQATGSQPDGLAVDAGTVYALTQLGAGALSVFGALP